MEPYLPLTSKCARFCLSGATVLFWVTEHLTPSCVFLYACLCVCVLFTIIHSEYFPMPSHILSTDLYVCVLPTDFSDSGLYYRGHSVQAGRVCCLCKYNQRPYEEDPVGGQVHHSAACDFCHGFLHQLCHHHDPQLLLWESGRLDHWYG